MFRKEEEETLMVQTLNSRAAVHCAFRSVFVFTLSGVARLGVIHAAGYIRR